MNRQEGGEGGREGSHVRFFFWGGGTGLWADFE